MPKQTQAETLSAKVDAATESGEITSSEAKELADKMPQILEATGTFQKKIQGSAG